MKYFFYAILIYFLHSFIGVSYANPPIIVDQNTGQYLGTLSANPYDSDSVSNPYGEYGSEYSDTSINNPYGEYGSPYSDSSVNNPYASGKELKN